MSNVTHADLTLLAWHMVSIGSTPEEIAYAIERPALRPHRDLLKAAKQNERDARTCIDCGRDISAMHGAAKRCVPCRRAVKYPRAGSVTTEPKPDFTSAPMAAAALVCVSRGWFRPVRQRGPRRARKEGAA